MKNIVLLVLALLSCKPEGGTNKEKPLITAVEKGNEFKRSYDFFDRNSCIERLKQKVENDEAIVVHINVPLCDNEHQGIVKVGKDLGDGLNLKKNLYWGAMYGIKSHFNRSKKWKLLKSMEDIDNNILERVIFYKEYSNSAKVYLIADAYRGDKMKDCLSDFFDSVSGNNKEKTKIGDQEIGIKSNADLIIFNGHNGLMDTEVDYKETVDDKIRDVSVIGCISHNYFKAHLMHSKGYPLLMTTNLLAPEAYVVEGLIDSWAALNGGEKIKKAAGKAYDNYQKCGIKGATKLFRTGWE